MCKKSLIDNDYSVVYYIDRKGGGAEDQKRKNKRKSHTGTSC